MNKHPWFFLVISIIILVFLLILYSKMAFMPETPKRFRIHMVADTIQYKMTSYPHQQEIYSLNIEITGSLDGKAYMNFAKEGEEYSETIYLDKSKVDHTLNLNWPTNACMLSYYPVDVENGEILLKYRFFGPAH